MFKHRLITSIILIPTVIYCIFFLSLNKFLIINFLIYLLSAWEWSRLSGLIINKKKIMCTLYFCIFPIVLSIIQSYDLFFQLDHQIHFILKISLIWWIFSIFLIFSYAKHNFIWKKLIFIRINFGILTVFPCFCGILSIRSYCYSNNRFFGSWLLLYIISTVWSIDSGSYIFGKIFGRKKLLSNISPNKTVEGLIGGVILSIFPTFFFKKYIFLNTKKLILTIYWILIVIFSIVGDLSESMFKRIENIKDTGNIIPGHGGILDRIDSLTAVIPILSYLILNIKIC